MSKKIIRLLLCLCLLILVINFSEPVTSRVNGTESQTPVNVGNLISELAKEDITGNNFWNLVAQIESNSKDNLVEIRNGLQNPDVKVRIGCAKMMYQLGYRDEAVKTLKAILVLPAANVDNQ